jgi:hypothetical protein
VRFGDLDFIVTMEGVLAWEPVVVQPFHSTGLDAITEMLEEPRLHALEAYAPGSGWLLDFNHKRLEHQLRVFLGPQPSREDLHHLTFSFVNVMTQLTGESRSP